jgi:hypothetical protein
MLVALHHDVDCNVVFARSGMAIKEGREKLGGDDNLNQRSVSALGSKRQRLRQIIGTCNSASSKQNMTTLPYCLWRVWLATRSHKLLKHKALILVVHALVTSRVNGGTECKDTGFYAHAHKHAANCDVYHLIDFINAAEWAPGKLQ